MKFLLKSETFLGIVFSLILTLIFFFAFLWATQPEQWYVGEHDSQCEATSEKENCNCAERLANSESFKE